MVNYDLYGDEVMTKKLSVITDEGKAKALLQLLDPTPGTSEGADVPHELTAALDHIRSVAASLAD